MDFSIIIGGQAGQGMQTIGTILTKIFSRGGYHIFAYQDYQSRIRGGHNFYQLRVADKPVDAPHNRIDLLLALDAQSITEHLGIINDNGGIIYESSKSETLIENNNGFDLPLQELAVSAGGNKIYVNSVASGAALGLLDYDFGPLEKLLKETFAKKDEAVQLNNVKAARAGYDFARGNCAAQFQIKLKPRPQVDRMVINGNEAIALGALAAGCNFYAAYPMTPATSIMTYLAKQQTRFDILVEQAEDEIAALNMVLGASFTGARAMTGTSGGGFALMVEALSLAGITETPAVIALSQRPGPATGLPTRTEQGELLFALHAGHGEFARAIFTPGSVEEAFYLTQKAFNLAARHQIPVIILTDQYLADSCRNVEPFDVMNLKIERYVSQDENPGYLRHKLTENGISPRLVPGKTKNLVVTDSDEHTEDGHLTEDLTVRIKMSDKRNRKFKALAAEVEAPLLDGDAATDLLLIGWGSTYGVIKETAARLREEGGKVSQLHFPQVYPFPAERVTGIFQNAGKKVLIENNSSGQLGWLIRAETGLAVDKKILKYDGRPFSVDYILGELDQ